MTVRILTRSELPKQRRNRISPLMRTPDWTVVSTHLLNGLKPDQVLMMVFSPEELKRLGINNIRHASRPVKRWIKEKGLPYTVVARTTSEGGVITIENKVARRRKTA